MIPLLHTLLCSIGLLSFQPLPIQCRDLVPADQVTWQSGGAGSGYYKDNAKFPNIHIRAFPPDPKTPLTGKGRTGGGYDQEILRLFTANVYVLLFIGALQGKS